MGTERTMSKKKIGTKGKGIPAKPKPKNKDDMSKGKKKMPFKLT